MRVLVLGAGGMLGHKLWQCFRDRFDTWAAARSAYARYERYGLFDPRRFLGGVEVADFDSVAGAVLRVHADVVVNCIGIVKQAPEARDPDAAMTVNGLFPHRLAHLCQAAGSRLIHISTDCVFSGEKGRYKEEEECDARDVYGLTKFLGEVDGAGCLTLRTSFVGRELEAGHGVVEWFLAHPDGAVPGYTRAVFSGLTTQALADLIAELIEHHPSLRGVYHVSSHPLSKHTLLCLLRAAYQTRVEIEPDPGPKIDRSLDSSRLRAATGLSPETWPRMVGRMVEDSTPYAQWRNIQHGG